jgi:hypothetical protein
MHTNTQFEETLQTVNSLGHYPFQHKSIVAVIPSFKKISVFMRSKINRNLYEDYGFVGCDTM